MRTLTSLLLLALAATSSLAQTAMDVDQFRNDFNALSSDLRVLITNDPDCGGCLYMVQQEMDVFEDPNGCGMNDGITYMFNWVKVLGGTQSSAVLAHEQTWPAPRHIHYWDEFQLLGDLYLTTLNLVDPSPTGGNTAWHTVLCYEPGVVWDTTEQHPPMPTFWMHKLSEQYNADQSIYFTPETFAIGFNELACLTSIYDQQTSSKVELINRNGVQTFRFSDVKQNSNLLISSVDGKTQVVYPVSNNGTVKLTNRLSAGLYLYTLIEDGVRYQAEKFILTK